MQLSNNYTPKTAKQLQSWYNAKKRKGNINFNDFETFLDWYSNQEKKCFYCEVEEKTCYEVVVKSKLISNRFPLNGLVSRGKNRGVWLEIDKKNPKGNYSKENSVLCCYFCNNDKSDVFNAADYSNFINNRKHFLENLIDKIV